MKLHIPKDKLKSRGLPPSIFYNPDPTIGKSLSDRSGSLKVGIKIQPGYRGIKTVVIYMLLFKMGNTEAILKFIMLLNNITQGQDMSTGP